MRRHRQGQRKWLERTMMTMMVMLRAKTGSSKFESLLHRLESSVLESSSMI